MSKTALIGLTKELSDAVRKAAEAATGAGEIDASIG
jgi:hypothetical protein